MEQLRTIFLVVLCLIGYLFYKTWPDEHADLNLNTVNTESSAQNIPASSTSLPALNTLNPTPSTQTLAQPMVSSARLVQVKTDVLDLTIDTQGGDIVKAQLLQYPRFWNTPKTPVVLLNNDPESRYLAKSILVGSQGLPSSLNTEANYTAEQNAYTLQEGNNSLHVVLHWKKQGINIDKEYVFHRGGYAVDVNYHVDNQSNQAWSGNVYSQLMRVNRVPEEKNGFTHAYFGASLSTPDNSYKKISFKDMDKLNQNGDPVLSNPIVKGGWVAMQQHYFLSSWIPPAQESQHFYSQVYPNGLYTIGMMGPAITVAPGQNQSATMKLYVGPESNEQLEAVAPKLNLTIDYGFLWPISLSFLWIMSKIYKVVGNWGWSIVILTILIKLAFYKLSSMSYHSMAKMRDLQPKMQALKDRFGDDKAKLSQATMEMYKSEKVNPLGGCLPVVVQIPFFIALYWVLAESVALRQAPFLLWIHDLSLRDPYYILPIFMVVTMFIQQKLSPTPPDPMQAKMMMVLPLVFGILFMTFPAGLVLYWVVNNTVSILQQWYITQSYQKKAHPKRK